MDRTQYTRIVIPKPPIGGKSTILRGAGLYVLEEGPGLVWHLLCMHAGDVGITLYDGVVDANGVVQHARRLFELTPALLGVWHLNVGFQFGLVAHIPRHSGHVVGNAGCMVPVWMAKGDMTAKRGEMHTKTLEGTGSIREVVTSKDALLYQAQVTMAGLGPAHIFDGTGRELWQAPAGIVGSFTLEQVFCRDGIRVAIDSAVAARLTLTWYDAPGGE